MLCLPSLLYPLFVSASIMAVKQRPAIKSRLLRIRDAHNLALSVFSLVVATKTALMLSRKAGIVALICDRAEDAPLLEWTWYASKIWEWVDTLLLIASEKEVSHLHFNHHLTTPAVVASHMIFRPVRTSVFDVPMLLNAIAHTLMYAYYYSPKSFFVLKRGITSFQILQHITALFCIAASSIIFSNSERDERSCDISLSANFLSFFMYCMYLFQFCYFYLNSYTKNKTSLHQSHEL